MVSGCSCRMRKTTACVASAWMPSSTVSCWSVGTWLPAPSVASAWVSVPSAGSMWCEPCTCSSPETEAPLTRTVTPNLTPNISMHRRDWKATLQRLKLFLNVIFTTKWGQKDPPELWKHWSMPWACLPVDTWASGLSWALSHIPWTLIEVSLFVPCGHQPLLSWEDTYPVLLFLLHPIFNLNCSDVWNFCPLWMRSVSTSGRHGTCWTVAPLNVHFISHVYFKC